MKLNRLLTIRDFFEEIYPGYSNQFWDEEFNTNNLQRVINQVVNQDGLSALSWAIANKLPIQQIKDLIELSKADVTFGGTYESPLFYAATTNRPNRIELLSYLLDKGAYNVVNEDPSIRNPDNQPLLVKILSDPSMTDKKSVTDIICLLLHYGADGIQSDEYGHSAFGIIVDLADRTGDENYINLTNEIILAGLHRRVNGTNYSYLPLPKKRESMVKEWLENIDLLTTQTLSQICEAIYVPKETKDQLAAEIESRNQAQTQESITVTNDNSNISLPTRSISSSSASALFEGSQVEKQSNKSRSFGF